MTRFLLFDFGYRYDPSSHCSTALVCLWLLVSLLHGTPPHSCSPEAQRTPTCVTCCMEPGLAGGLDPMISCGPFRPLPLCSSVIPPGSHRPHRESAVLCGTWVQSPPYPQQFLPCCLVWRGLISAGAAVHLPAGKAGGGRAEAAALHAAWLLGSSVLCSALSLNGPHLHSL